MCRRYSDQPTSESSTPVLQRFCCGVGHVIDDILRQLLFSFRLVFFMKVLGLSAANAGWLILQKQLAHFVFSPICAFLVDSINIPFLSRKLGRRKSWLLIGNGLEVVFIPLFFGSCFPCRSDGGQWQLMVSISILNTILAFAGTLMNVGHLSIIPVIAKDQSEAVEMSAWRTAFSFLSGILTLAVAWAILGQDTSEHLSAESAMDFTVMALILVGIGLVFCLIFHVGTKEPIYEMNKKMSIKVAEIMRKSSHIASDTVLQSMTFFETDANYKKEGMRDRFIDSLKTKDKPVTEEGGPVRKKSFARHFVNALFTIDEDKENKNNEGIPSVYKGEIAAVSKRLEIDTSSSSKSRAQDDDEMLNDVKQLPQERKISVLVSIVYGLAGLDTDAAETLPEKYEERKTSSGVKSSARVEISKDSSGLYLPSEANGNHVGDTNEAESEEKYFQASHLASTESLGVDNKGLECNKTEINPSYPEQITGDINVDETLTSNEIKSGSLELHCKPSLETAMNSKMPSIVFDDPEYDLPVTPTPKTVGAWLKDPRLYMVAIIFTCTKILQDVAYAYLPLFLIYTVQFGKEAIAYVPLVMLISATVSSGISKKLVGIIGSKSLFILSALFVIGAGLWFYFITQSNKVMTYPAVVLLGFGFSIMLVNVLSFAAELIGNNKSTSGVVFAFMGLMSNVFGGSLFAAIQKLYPQGSNSEDCERCGEYVRHVFSFVLGALAAICLLIVLLFEASQRICKRLRNDVSKTDTRTEEVTDTRL